MKGGGFSAELLLAGERFGDVEGVALDTAAMWAYAARLAAVLAPSEARNAVMVVPMSAPRIMSMANPKASS